MSVTCIVKCFSSCGFVKESATQAEDDDNNLETRELDSPVTQLDLPVNAQQLLAVDDNLPREQPFDGEDNASQVVESVLNSDEVDNEEADGDLEVIEEGESISFHDALQIVGKLQRFSTDKFSKILPELFKIENSLFDEMIRRKKQKSALDNF